MGFWDGNARNSLGTLSRNGRQQTLKNELADNSRPWNMRPPPRSRGLGFWILDLTGYVSGSCNDGHRRETIRLSKTSEIALGTILSACEM